MTFGGSSLAGTAAVEGAARGLVAAHESGLRAVGVIPAMGGTTDELLALARGVSERPEPRELDLLLSAGEQISCALVAMAVDELGYAIR